MWAGPARLSPRPKSLEQRIGQGGATGRRGKDSIPSAPARVRFFLGRAGPFRAAGAGLPIRSEGLPPSRQPAAVAPRQPTGALPCAPTSWSSALRNRRLTQHPQPAPAGRLVVWGAFGEPPSILSPGEGPRRRRHLPRGPAGPCRPRACWPTARQEREARSAPRAVPAPSHRILRGPRAIGRLHRAWRAGCRTALRP